MTSLSPAPELQQPAGYVQPLSHGPPSWSGWLWTSAVGRASGPEECDRKARSHGLQMLLLTLLSFVPHTVTDETKYARVAGMAVHAMLIPFSGSRQIAMNFKPAQTTQ